MLLKLPTEQPLSSAKKACEYACRWKTLQLFWYWFSSYVFYSEWKSFNAMHVTLGVFSVLDKAGFLYETLKSHEEPTHIGHHNRNDERTNTVVHCICFLAKTSNKQALLGIQHFPSEHIRLWRVHWSYDVHVNDSKCMVFQLFLNGLLYYLYLYDTAYSPTHIHRFVLSRIFCRLLQAISFTDIFADIVASSLLPQCR